MEGSVVRADYDPAAGFGEPDVFEDFEGTDGLFSTFSGIYNSHYGGGVFNISYARKGWWGWNIGDVGLIPDFSRSALI